MESSFHGLRGKKTVPEIKRFVMKWGEVSTSLVSVTLFYLTISYECSYHEVKWNNDP